MGRLPGEEIDLVSENNSENGFNQDSEDSSLSSATESETVLDEIVVKSQPDTDCKEALKFTCNNNDNQSKKLKSKDKIFELSFTKNKRKTTIFDQNAMNSYDSDTLSLSTSSFIDIHWDQKDEINYCIESVDINHDCNFHSIHLKHDHLSPSQKYGLFGIYFLILS